MTTIEELGTSKSSNDESGHAAQQRWLLFFFVLLPTSMLAFGILSQIVAYELGGIQPFRSSLDTIAVAAEREQGNAQWLIFGDSLTQHVLMDYSLGPSNVIANLTTHAGAGMPSMYLLLRRYLATHSAPKAIMLAMSPETFTRIPSKENGAFWLTPTFLEPQEQAWLSQFYPSARVRAWVPAVFDLKASVLDPLTGLLAPERDHLIVGADNPSLSVPAEAPSPPSAITIKSDANRAAYHLELGATRSVLTDICHIARQNDIAIHLILVPLPTALRKVWEERGDLARLNQQVSDLMTRECGRFFLYDMADSITIPNFDDDGTHIVGRGWESRYALALKDYIKRADTSSLSRN
jgi:hypothetical protein